MDTRGPHLGVHDPVRVAGDSYRVSFDHQSSKAGEYAWVTGYDRAAGPIVTRSTAIGEVTETERFEQTVDASFCGDTFVGLQRVGSAAGADVIVDNLLVEDLGESSTIAACATLTGGAHARRDQAGCEPGVRDDVHVRRSRADRRRVGRARGGRGLGWPWRATRRRRRRCQSAARSPRTGTSWRRRLPTVSNHFVATAGYTTTAEPIGDRSVTSTTVVRTLPGPPQADVFASDHPWVSATNGWGPVERDRANGEQGEGDGQPITLAGVVYEKGLGADAPSTVRYYLGGYCTAFTASVGIDDVQRTRGSVVFSVVADGRTVRTPPVLGPNSATYAIDADISGAQYVELIAGTTADGNGNDHADWG